MVRRYVVLLPALVLVWTAAQAQQPQARPDLSGFWAPATRGVMPDKTLLDKLAPNTVLIDDVGATELPSGEFGGLQVKPAALEAASRWTPEQDMTLDKACAAPSIVYAMQGPFPMEIHQATELTVIKLEYFDMVRLVFTDGRSRPSGIPHSKVGYSIGRWDGPILVVETTHLSPSTITNNGLDHSDRIRVIERFMLSSDGRTLLATQEFEDPEVLDNRGARFMAWTRMPGQHVYPYDCDPSFAAEFLNR